TMGQWFDAEPVTNLPAGAKRCLTVAQRPIALLNIDGQVHAISNICPHAGLPLGEGECHGSVIICPYHGYAYDVRTGRNIDWPHDEPPVKTYPVRIENGMIQVYLEETSGLLCSDA